MNRLPKSIPVEANTRNRLLTCVQDIHFRVQGPVVTQLQEVFVDDWLAAPCRLACATALRYC
jgi:phosphatidylserine/phosphatidylglycerophosphate/cardiolipin synthase-like enzyme